MEVRAGALRAHYDRPEGEGPFPGVIVLAELYGLNDDIRSIARRLADNGYAAVAPDLYSFARPRALCMVKTATDIMRNGSTTPERVEEVRTWLALQPEVDAARIGVIGFCMGAGLAYLTAARGNYAAVSANYGFLPHDISELEHICPVVASYGSRDVTQRRIPERLREVLERAGVSHDIVAYPTAGHSFMNHGGPRIFDTRGPYAYNHEASEDAWRRILTWFDRHLR